jgi:hypothetical protein
MSTLHLAGRPTPVQDSLPVCLLRRLTGLDFHQLDSIKRFHSLIVVPPLPRFSWRDSPHYS